MSVSLRWLLEQEDLRLRLVAGSAGGVVVEWAHSIELEDPTPWLTGSELVLTTGLRLARNAAGQRRYVERLAHARVAGLAFGAGVRFSRVPPGVVGACQELDLPLIEVPLPTPFVAVTKRLADQLALEQRSVLERAVNFQRSLTRRTLRHGIDGLVTALASELGAQVAVLDEHAVALATSPRARLLASRLEAELAGSSTPRSAAGGLRRLETDSGVLELHRLRGRTTYRGWLAVSVPGEVTHGARLLINQAVSLATLHLDQPGELEQARASLGSAVADLLLENEPLAAAAVPGLRHLGFAPREVVRVLWVPARDRSPLAATAERQLADAGIPHAVTTKDAGVVVLVADKDHRNGLDVLLKMTSQGAIAGPIGISSPVPPSRVAHALIQARRAARAAELTDSPAVSFDDLGLEAVLGDEVIRARVEALTDRWVAPLLDPSSSSAEDLRTVRRFLDCNGAWEPASRALGIHRHTLRNRIERIERATGLSLHRAEDRALLLLALSSRESTGV